MLLDYTTYTNVVGTADFFNKLRAWCVHSGWTQEEWIPEVSWGVSVGVGDWRSYTGGGFLQMSKTGYGSQNLIVSLAAVAYEEFAAHGITGSMRSQVAYLGGGFGDLANPISQNVLCGPPASQPIHLFYNLGGCDCGALDLTRDSIIPKVWFFAGPHWICAVAQMNSIFCHMIHFGSFEMYESNPSQGHTFGVSGCVKSELVAPYHDNWAWTLYTTGAVHTVPFTVGYAAGYSYYRNFGVYFYYHSRSSGIDDNMMRMRDNCHVVGPTYAAMENQGYHLLGLGDALKANHYSEKRPLIKPVYFLSRPLDNVWEPICRAPVWATRFSGLQIGEQIDFGGESYLVFPTRTVYSTQGYAFRIA